MKAIQMKCYGHSDVLSFESIDIPKAGPLDLLIKVHAIGINPVDLKFLNGKFSGAHNPNFPITFGSDFAGEIVEKGYLVENLKKGDKVYGSGFVFSGGTGALAQYIRVNHNNISLIPEGLDYVVAASVVTSGCTAQEAVNINLNIKPNQKVLIHGAGGSVGYLATQLALSIGAEVAVTVSDKDIELMKGLGVDLIINYQIQNFEDIIKDYDAVLDTQGGSVLKKSYNAIRPGGKIVSLVEQPDKNELLRKRATGSHQHTLINTIRLNTLSFLIEEKIITPRRPYSDIFNNAIVAIDNKLNINNPKKLVITIPNT